MWASAWELFMSCRVTVKAGEIATAEQAASGPSSWGQGGG